MATPTISDSVGRKAANKREDVATIQGLLNAATRPALNVTGICDEETIKRIMEFQKTFLSVPDGRIDVNGRTMAQLVLQTSGFLLLSQAPNAAHYSISSADRQFGTSTAIDTIISVANAFVALHPGVAIGVGDISFRNGGSMPPHASHTRGIDADIRPLRKDGRKIPVTIHDAAYSGERTGALIGMFLADPSVKKILFNDRTIPGVTPFAGHDNHFHVNMKR